MLILRQFTSLLPVFLSTMAAIPAKHERLSVSVSCSNQRMPVQSDKQVALPTTMNVYARMSGENGYSIEMDQAGFDAILDRMPNPKTPGWTSEKALLRSRLRAADSHRPIRLKDLLHADERPNALPKKGPALQRHIEIDWQWMQVFVIGMTNGHARVLDATGGHALKLIRLRSYGSRTPLKNDSAHSVEGILITAGSHTVYDYCMVIPVAVPPQASHERAQAQR